MTADSIIIRGARQHNLKNIDVTIPRNRLVVITGLSGSGKSTLAFDTLYAEGQRRYVESLSAYARQFLERMEKPDVDMIDGLSPAIAIEQKSAGHNPRSTVGTVTEIYDYLRLLYARAGTRHCHQCGQAIEAQTVDQMVDQILSLPEGTRLIILAPLVAGQKGSHAGLIRRLKKEGFARVRIDGQIQELEPLEALPKSKTHDIDVVVDRLVIKPAVGNRLADSLELALALSEGPIVVDLPEQAPMVFSENAGCRSCHITYPDLTPAAFSFNSPHGACPQCDGLGTVTEFEPQLIIPNPELSLREGAVTVWAHRNTVHFMEFLEALTSHYGVDIYTPVKHLPEHFVTVLLYGSGDAVITHYFEHHQRRHTYRKPFEGIIPNLMRRLKETTSARTKEDIRRYMSHQPCAACNGCRLNPVSRSVRIGGATIAEVTAMAISRARRFVMELDLAGHKAVIAHRIVKEIHARLSFLENVGLGYLTLARPAETLSGGEMQRIRLATQIGSKLSGVLYVLDEPSIGLHQRDNHRLLQTLVEMRDIGNSVLVVEHDTDTILAADHVIDMGPEAGINGGQVVFSGPPGELLEAPASLTGQYLAGRRTIEVPGRRRRQNPDACLRVVAAAENNLKEIDVSFPLGLLNCVTGVSGSGKSTLVLDTLFRFLARRLYRTRLNAGRCETVEGTELVDKIINIDQSPIGRTPRSNPGTYTGLFAPIRELFSKTPEARMRGYKAGRFSFNVKGGRCEACQGDGILKIEMHFLPDVYVTCDVCRGKRYNRETLEVRYKGRSIADVLDMTVNQAARFFERIEPVRSRLRTLAEVGMGYIRLGQPATTLSGGEAQRIKLARELSKKETGRTVYILDEPTTGLHFEDIRKLLVVLNRLVDAGNTVIVIEHNLDVIKTADHIVDLGPEGGDEGGYVVASGTPEQVAGVAGSHTGHYLKTVLADG